MTRRQLWSSPHSNDKPDKWLEDFSFEAEKPAYLGTNEWEQMKLRRQNE